MGQANRRHIVTLCGSVAACAFFCGTASAQTDSSVSQATSQQAADQATGPATANQIDDVVVTAQKRSERLIDVPVPVTAIESDTLIRQNIVRLQDYATRVPGLSVTGTQTSQISLRGVQANGGSSPTVAVTIDDVPFGPSSWAGIGQFPDIDPADLSRIEVLRGPQGTLYGAASLGGLIKLVTNDPDSNEWSGRIEGGASHADDGANGYSIRGSVNVPIVKDMLAIRASGYRREDPAYIDNIIVNDPRRVTAANPTGRTGTINAQNANLSKVDGYRVAAWFRPVDILTINASRLVQTRNTQNGGGTEVVGVDDLTPRFGYFQTIAGANRARTRQELNQLRATLDLPFATLASVSGWGRTSNDAISESQTAFPFVFAATGAIPAVIPNAPAGSFTRLVNGSRTRKFSQEVRLASNGGGDLEWLIGGFYTKERSQINQNISGFGPDGANLGLVVDFPLPSSFREIAGFADATYHFTDKFDVQVGVRYSENKQTYQANQTVAPGGTVFFGPTRVGAVSTSSDDAFTWLVTPRYRFDDDNMVYARIASGYRPGGPNTAAAPSPSFEPDTVINYEIGAKGRAFNRVLTYDVSYYLIDWDDIQLGATTLGGQGFFLNGGRSRSYGFEGAVQVSPGGGWRISANATVANTKLRDDLPRNPAGPTAPYLLGFRGDRIPDQARFTGNLGVDKTFDVSGDLQATVGFNLTHVGERHLAFRTSTFPVARQTRLTAPGYQQLDLFATLTDGDWDLSAFIRNVGSSRGVLTLADTPTQPIITAAFQQPQTIGFTIARRF